MSSKIPSLLYTVGSAFYCLTTLMALVDAKNVEHPATTPIAVCLAAACVLYTVGSALPLCASAKTASTVMQSDKTPLLGSSTTQACVGNIPSACFFLGSMALVVDIALDWDALSDKRDKFLFLSASLAFVGGSVAGMAQSTCKAARRQLSAEMLTRLFYISGSVLFLASTVMAKQYRFSNGFDILRSMTGVFYTAGSSMGLVGACSKLSIFNKDAGSGGGDNSVARVGGESPLISPV
jgi:hypothetical protein